MDQEIRAASKARRHATGRVSILAVAGIVALAIAVGLGLWLVLRGGGEKRARPQAPAAAASQQRLVAFARSVGHPVYWAGPQPRFTYELSRTKDGRVYIRYLPPGVKVGTSRPNYLTIGTYPQRNALATLRATAEKQRARLIGLRDGGLAFQYKSRPTSVYIAFPGSNYQIEVFDPSSARALQLVVSGQVLPVGSPARTPGGSATASVEQLRALAASVGHEIYWAGAQPRHRYELTKTSDGSVYIRYLPAGVPVGTRRPKYLTVATYPQKGALALLESTAAKNGVPTIKLAGGGLAMVDNQHPGSVYVAYPSSDLEVEVYDPAPGKALQIVASGRIVPVH
jgi:hypothetical protein